jgi:signal transduction histidine kinase
MQSGSSDVRTLMIYFFDRLPLRQKFLLLGCLCLVMVILPSLLYWQETSRLIAFTQQEQLGLQPAQLLLNIIQRTQQHRGLSTRLLAAPQISKQDRLKKAEDVDKTIAALEAYLVDHPNDLLRVDLAEQKDLWRRISDQVSDRHVSVEENFQIHSSLIHLQLSSLESVVQSFKLGQDPASHGYNLITASLIDVPALTEALGQLRGTGVALLSQGSASYSERVQFESLILISKDKMNELEEDIAKAQTGGKAYPALDSSFARANGQYQQVIRLAQAELLAKEHFNYDPNEFYGAFTFAVNGFFSYSHGALEEIGLLLQERLVQTSRQIYGMLSYLVLSTLLVALVCLRVVRQLLRQLGGEPEYATAVVQAISHGDLNGVIQTDHPESLLGNMRIMQDKLKENDRLKNEFVATVSHELRTPLTAVSGALAIALSGKLGELPRPVQQLLGIAVKNNQRLTELINELLDIDRLVANQLFLNLKPQPLMPVINEATAGIKPYAEKLGIPLAVTGQCEGGWVAVDERRLRQVVVNLVSNALKFSQTGEPVNVVVSVSGQRARIEVVDSGRGIADEFKPQIFQKFVQEDSSATRAVGGAGLGLAIARELVLRMGGDIGFNSTLGVGSCFYVELPLVTAEEPD